MEAQTIGEGFFFLKLIPNLHKCSYILKDPSQLPPFSMPLKLLILHGEANSFCFTGSCVPESMFNYLK